MRDSDVPIIRPCPVEFEAEDFGSERRAFFCDHCDKNVHVLSNMTEREAAAFLDDNRGGDLCVSYLRDQSGEIQFVPEPPATSSSSSSSGLVPLARLRRRPRAAAAGLALALAACTPHGPQPEVTVDEVTVEQPMARGGAMVIPPAQEPAKPEPPPIETVAGGIMIPDDPPPVAKPSVEEPCDGEAQEATKIKEPRRVTKKRGKIKRPRRRPDKELDRVVGWGG